MLLFWNPLSELFYSFTELFWKSQLMSLILECSSFPSLCTKLLLFLGTKKLVRFLSLIRKYSSLDFFVNRSWWIIGTTKSLFFFIGLRTVSQYLLCLDCLFYWIGKNEARSGFLDVSSMILTGVVAGYFGLSVYCGILFSLAS